MTNKKSYKVRNHNGRHIFYFDGLRTLDFPSPINMRYKWTSLCMSLDYVQDVWVLYINGKDNVTDPWVPDGRNLTMKFTGNSSAPLVIRVGHYYFDNKPLIGKIVNFHVWNRLWEKYSTSLD